MAHQHVNICNSRSFSSLSAVVEGAFFFFMVEHLAKAAHQRSCRILLEALRLLALPPTLPCLRAQEGAGAHFTCFTGTKVQVLTLNVYISASAARSTPTTARQRAAPGTRFAHFTCLTSTKVQILRTRPQQPPGRGPREVLYYSLYPHY